MYIVLLSKFFCNNENNLYDFYVIALDFSNWLENQILEDIVEKQVKSDHY